MDEVFRCFFFSLDLVLGVRGQGVGRLREEDVGRHCQVLIQNQGDRQVMGIPDPPLSPLSFTRSCLLAYNKVNYFSNHGNKTTASNEENLTV